MLLAWCQPHDVSVWLLHRLSLPCMPCYACCVCAVCVTCLLCSCLLGHSCRSALSEQPPSGWSVTGLSLQMTLKAHSGACVRGLVTHSSCERQMSWLECDVAVIAGPGPTLQNINHSGAIRPALPLRRTSMPTGILPKQLITCMQKACIALEIHRAVNRTRIIDLCGHRKGFALLEACAHTLLYKSHMAVQLSGRYIGLRVSMSQDISNAVQIIEPRPTWRRHLCWRSQAKLTVTLLAPSAAPNRHLYGKL